MVEIGISRVRYHYCRLRLAHMNSYMCLNETFIVFCFFECAGAHSVDEFQSKRRKYKIFIILLKCEWIRTPVYVFPIESRTSQLYSIIFARCRQPATVYCNYCHRWYRSHELLTLKFSPIRLFINSFWTNTRYNETIKFLFQLLRTYIFQ